MAMKFDDLTLLFNEENQIGVLDQDLNPGLLAIEPFINQFF